MPRDGPVLLPDSLQVRAWLLKLRDLAQAFHLQLPLLSVPRTINYTAQESWSRKAKQKQEEPPDTRSIFSYKPWRALAWSNSEQECLRGTYLHIHPDRFNKQGNTVMMQIQLSPGLQPNRSFQLCCWPKRRFIQFVGGFLHSSSHADRRAVVAFRTRMIHVF